MATISNNNIARGIYLLSKDNTYDPSKVVKFLVRKRLLSQSKDILSRLQKIINHENGTIVAHVSSTEELSSKVKKHLTEILAQRYSAKHVAFDEKVDKDLLGGLRVEVNDEVIDLTIKNKIKKLQEYLTTNHE